MTFKSSFSRLALAALSAALIALTAAPAAAQYYRYDPLPPPGYGGRIPPQHIEAMVRSLGYTPTAYPRPRGPLWVTHAVDRDGNHVRVLIDGYTGRVIDVLRRPRGVAVVPPPERRPYPPPQRVEPNYPPQAANPNDEYDDDEDDGPGEYDDVPQNGPAPRTAPAPQQGPSVIPFDRKGGNNQRTTKKQNTAALNPKAQQTAPTPKRRPQDAPKRAEVKPKPEAKPAPEIEATGALPPMQGLDPNQKSKMPPVQGLE